MQRAQTIRDIRRLADFLELHSDIPLPSSFNGQLHLGLPSEFKRSAKEMLRHGATVEVVGSYAIVRMTLGMGVTFTVQTGVNPLLGDRPAPDKTERVLAELEG